MNSHAILVRFPEWVSQWRRTEIAEDETAFGRLIKMRYDTTIDGREAYCFVRATEHWLTTIANPTEWLAQKLNAVQSRLSSESA